MTPTAQFYAVSHAFRILMQDCGTSHGYDDGQKLAVYNMGSQSSYMLIQGNSKREAWHISQ